MLPQRCHLDTLAVKEDPIGAAHVAHPPAHPFQRDHGVPTADGVEGEAKLAFLQSANQEVLREASFPHPSIRASPTDDQLGESRRARLPDAWYAVV
jgi:hypothetical protein